MTRSSTVTADLPEGSVRVTRNPDRDGLPWYLVELGRARYVKRFNLSPAEAAQVIAELRELGCNG